MKRINNTSEREYSRKGKHYDDIYRQELTGTVSRFLHDAFNKDDKKILELYEQYDGIWTRHAERLNGLNKFVTCFTDAFESAIKNGHKNVENLKCTPIEKEEYRRIFELLRQKTRWERFVIWWRLYVGIEFNFTPFKPSEEDKKEADKKYGPLKKV